MKQTIFLDSTLQKLHEQVLVHSGEIKLPKAIKPEQYFGQLVENIIGQQLSNKVADVIVKRVKDAVGGTWQPELVLVTEHEKLRAAGVSNAKATYIHNIAQAWKDTKNTGMNLQNLSDEEVIEYLTRIKGIGRWTAEMFLLFSLGRPDVFSIGDYGLKRAIIKHYKVEPKAKPHIFLEISQQWQPQRSLASLILWRSLELPE